MTFHNFFSQLSLHLDVDVDVCVCVNHIIHNVNTFFCIRKGEMCLNVM